MQAFVQRVTDLTTISINEGEPKGFSGPGLVVLLGWERRDEERSDLAQVEEWILSRCTGLRVFPDRAGKMNLSLVQYLNEFELSEGGILWVSQFTLSANLESGFRPSFTLAMNTQFASVRYSLFKDRMAHLELSPKVQHVFGEFGADMNLSFTNWGPLSIPLSK